MRKLLFTLCALACVGCATVSDGPFKQVEGRPIDYAKLAQLVENQSTIKDATALLGEPSARVNQADGSEMVEYRSAKRRESVERIMGVTRERHSQTMREVVTLVFRDGILMKVQKNSDVSSQ